MPARRYLHRTLRSGSRSASKASREPGPSVYGKPIRTDEARRLSLNDLHVALGRAPGADPRSWAVSELMGPKMQAYLIRIQEHSGHPPVYSDDGYLGADCQFWAIPGFAQMYLNWLTHLLQGQSYLMDGDPQSAQMARVAVERARQLSRDEPDRYGPVRLAHPDQECEASRQQELDIEPDRVSPPPTSRSRRKRRKTGS